MRRVVRRYLLGRCRPARDRHCRPGRQRAPRALLHQGDQHRGDRRRLDLDGIHRRQPPARAGDEPADRHARRRHAAGRGRVRLRLASKTTRPPPTPSSRRSRSAPTPARCAPRSTRRSTPTTAPPTTTAPSPSPTPTTPAPTPASSSPTAATTSAPTTKPTSSTACRTYVIGFGGVAAGEDQARLKKIAGDTGGQLLPARRLGPAAGGDEHDRGGADLPDAAAPVQRPARAKARARPTASRSAPRPRRSRSPSPGPARSTSSSSPGLKLTNKGHLLAVAGRPGKKPGKLKVTQHGRLDLHRAQGLAPAQGPAAASRCGRRKSAPARRKSA